MLAEKTMLSLPAAAKALPRLIVVVPAHDEELVLAATLESLARQQYPEDRYEVVVVADNCHDRTAAIARERGVTTMERTDPARRGKGHALNWAFAQLLGRPDPADAFVLVDADTWVAPDFLRLMAARLVTDTDAHGFCALQGRYGVLNPGDGWRAALMAGAFDLYNHVRPLGREWFGLGVGPKGNGMLFSRAVLRQARWRGDSLTEDIDYGLDLARRLRLRVGYVPQARVLAQMPAGAAQAASQRERWEGGRFRLVRERVLPLLWEGMRTKNLLLCDSALDLLLPPLAELGALMVLWAVLIGVGSLTHLLIRPLLWTAALGVSTLGLGLYIVCGLRLAGAPRAAYTALLRAPFYAVWKFGLYAARHAARKKGTADAGWVRTTRAPLGSVPDGKAAE